jgi:hypothetical protein
MWYGFYGTLATEILGRGWCAANQIRFYPKREIPVRVGSVSLWSDGQLGY